MKEAQKPTSPSTQPYVPGELLLLADLRLFSLLQNLLARHEAENKHGFWSDGEYILCKTEEQADALADFLEDVGYEAVTTGYFDPKEDEEAGQVDSLTGYWYVSV